MIFNRTVFFDSVRDSLFHGGMSQSQVDGMNAILSAWEVEPWSDDPRWLAYCLATTFHETSQEMQPIEEYGKGEGMSYGNPDPETGETYYGRGYVQLTWKDNYQRATDELGLSGPDDLVWHPERALNPTIAADTMFIGMVEGWFRSDDNGRETLERYFNPDVNDPYGAREIINGDKTKVPSWSGGVSIGNLIKGYHNDFLAALDAAALAPPEPEPEPEPGPEPEPIPEVIITIESDTPVRVIITAGLNVDFAQTRSL